MVLTSWARAVSGAIALALVAGCSDSGDPDLGEATCDESSAGFACDHVYLLSHLSLTDLGAGEGTHLNDITLVAPCFADDRLMGWVANRG